MIKEFGYLPCCCLIMRLTLKLLFVSEGKFKLGIKFKLQVKAVLTVLTDKFYEHK